MPCSNIGIACFTP
ncbi:hypothetical protein LL274_22525 [Vibrio parahaemolyticus]|nr:hypothetical protein [Vibrio parahaemolyticus]